MYPVAYSLKWGFWDGGESIANEYTVDGRDEYRVLEGTNGELNYGLIAVWSWDSGLRNETDNRGQQNDLDVTMKSP